jgi:hypothetical protein
MISTVISVWIKMGEVCQRGHAKYVLMSLSFKEGWLGRALHPCVVSSLSGVRRKWWPGLGIWAPLEMV